jgi:hypothetical protein
MNYAEKYRTIRHKYNSESDAMQLYYMHQEVLNLLFENAQLQSRIDFMKEGAI